MSTFELSPFAAAMTASVGSSNWFSNRKTPQKNEAPIEVPQIRVDYSLELTSVKVAPDLTLTNK